MIRATYELLPHGSAELVARTVTSGLQGGAAGSAAVVVDESGGLAVIDFPTDNIGGDPAVLLSALVGEALELAALTRCRLVDLDLPEGLLPGPARGAAGGVDVGVIVKPSVGLRPAEVAEVVRGAVGGGARFVKDDEMHTSPPWCPLTERVEAVAAVLEPGVVYCANVTGPAATLLDRARAVIDLGATGVLVNAFAQGLPGLLALRHAGLGVPILAHRAGSGALVRNRDFGLSGAVLARLTRLCGADYVIVGAFGGKLYDTDADVRANLDAVRGPLAGARAAVAAMGGGIGPDEVAVQVETAGGDGLLLLLGSAAYRHPGGLGAAVTAARKALGRG